MIEHKLTTCLLDATLFEDDPKAYHHGAVEHLFYGTGANRRALIKFDLSALPATAVVSSATMKLYAPLPLPTGPVSAYRVKRNWDEKSTWNTPWATAGCENTTSDRSATPIASTTVATGWNTFNLNKVEFELMRSANYGMVLVRTGEGGYADTIDINGRDAASNTPILTILYTMPGNPPPPAPPQAVMGTLLGSRYEVVWHDHQGTRKGVIQAFNSLEYVRTQNAVGSLVIDMPRALMQYDQFSVGDIFEVWREKGSALELQNETAYFLQNWEFYTDSEGAEYIRLMATDANWLLDTAIVWAAAGSSDADKTDYPDDMMKDVVTTQLGASAGSGRYKLTCAPDLSAGGSSVTKAFAYRNVLEVVTDLAEQANEAGVWVGFDVVRTAPGTFEFRTYTNQRGQNHGRLSGDPRLVGKQYGNLSEARFGTYRADERNAILVGGQGEGADRVTVTRTNATRMAASKWNRREYFKDSRDNETTAALEADGDAALDEFKPRQVLTGTLHDTPGMQYGIHYQFGDVLSVEAFGYFVDCHVKSVRVKVDQENGEQIDIKLEGEL